MKHSLNPILPDVTPGAAPVGGPVPGRDGHAARERSPRAMLRVPDRQPGSDPT